MTAGNDISGTPSPIVRRVVLTFEAGVQDAGAFDALAAFAAALHSELVGVFVGEAELLRVAALPFTRTVRLPTGTLEPLETATMAAQLERLAARARREMERAASRLRVRHSFLTLSRSADLAGIIEEVDLVVREASVTQGRSLRLHSSRATAVVPPRGLLLVRHPTAPLAGPVAAVYDGTAGGTRALAVAGALAAAGEGGLVVLLAGDDVETCRRLQAAAETELAAQAVEVTWRPMPGAGVDELRRVVAGERGLVIAGARDPLLGELPPEHLVSEVLHRSLLLVR